MELRPLSTEGADTSAIQRNVLAQPNTETFLFSREVRTGIEYVCVGPSAGKTSKRNVSLM